MIWLDRECKKDWDVGRGCEMRSGWKCSMALQQMTRSRTQHGAWAGCVGSGTNEAWTRIVCQEVVWMSRWDSRMDRATRHAVQEDLYGALTGCVQPGENEARTDVTHGSYHEDRLTM